MRTLLSTGPLGKEGVPFLLLEYYSIVELKQGSGNWRIAKEVEDSIETI